MSRFKDAYQRLNSNQREAVDSIDGPVLVVAGPGTGKTELLSTRVANILDKTDTDASSILCLTFTNKAATNMRERLYKLIGAEGHKTVVRTFHSFAADLMNSYPDYFWSGARLSVAPDAVQIEIIQSILAELPLDNPLSSTFAGAFTKLDDVKEALRLTKEAGLTPDDLRLIIQLNIGYLDKIEPAMVDILSASLSAKNLPVLEQNIGSLPEQSLDKASLILPLSQVIKESLSQATHDDAETGKTTHTGKWKKRWIQTESGKKGMFSERRRNEWWLQVADVYERYREQLHQRGYYDYSDMLIEVNQQLEKHPDMRADVQERFLYVLIDEFQDTNAAQLKLAHLVADHYSANNRPNLMAVGDDDQSIFAFNGAELNNMLSFKRSYPDTKLIVLNDNYRSSQDVLDISKAIIEQAEDRLVKREPGLTKSLTARNQPATKSRIQHISYPTRQHQLSGMVNRIKQAWDQNSGSIAVLARKHDSLRQLAGTLSEQKIPLRYEQKANILKHEAVEQIIDMSILANSIAKGDKDSTNHLIAKLIRHPMWNISHETLWQLATANYSSPDWLLSLLENNDKYLQNIGNWLAWLARNSDEQPLPVMIEHMLGLRQGQYILSPFKEYYLSARPVSSEYLNTLSAIALLQSLVQEFSANPVPTLGDFVRFVQLNLSTDRIIADESWFMSGERAVELLTVHKAKGLEFDHVFLIDAIENNWRPRGSRRKPPANLRLESYGEKFDDYARLLYVAASRAKQDLTVTSYSTGSNGEELLPTPFLSALPLEIVEEANEEPIQLLEADIKWPRLESNNEKALLTPRLEAFSLSPSSLIDFLNIAEAGPGSFLERHLLRLPVARSPVGSYGTAIHAALETAQRLVNTSKLSLDSILDRFDAAIENEHLPPMESEQYKHKGQNLLKGLFESGTLENLPKGSLVEQKLSNIMIGAARVGGKLDRIDLPDKAKAIVVDYKTGKPLPSLETKNKTLMVKAWRHKTQLLFYCLLVGRSDRFKHVNDMSAEIHYVEAEDSSKQLLSFKPQTADLNRLEKLIEAVWQRIMDLNFPDTAGYSQDINGINDLERDLLEGKI